MESTANKSITAAIDLGSNSFRLLIAGIDGGDISVQVNRLETVRLGKGLATSGKIPPEIMNRGLDVLASFKIDLAHHNIERTRCCGTQALRQAGNAHAFLDKAESLLGTKIEIIGGHEEAALNCKGVLAGLDKDTLPPFLVIDVGGGSTEIAYLQTASSSPQTISIPLGAVSWSEISETSRARNFIDSQVLALQDFLDSIGITPGKTRIIGSGGTATALATLALGLDRYDSEKVQGHFLELKHLDEIAGNLSPMSLAERNLLPGLEQGRGDIIMAGLEIYQEILATIEVEGMIISDFGLLEGILLSSLEQ
ncbi:MAG: hypothetical protein ABFQ82_01085 [Thermodesulfobacteriota bacterium]